MNSLKVAIGLGIVLVAFLGIYFFLGESASVSAQGTSSLKVEPDLASVYLSIESRHTTSAKVAQDNHDVKSDLLYSKLNAIGISDEEIETSYYNVGPEYDYTSNGQKIKGYLVTQQIVIKLEDFSKVVSVIDSGVDAGALISGINFELSPDKQSEYKSQALEEASADAKKKAEATASGLGKKIGRLVSVESSDFNYGPVVYYAKSDSGGYAEAREAALQINPTDVDVYASVSVTYRIR